MKNIMQILSIKYCVIKIYCILYVEVLQYNYVVSCDQGTQHYHHKNQVTTSFHKHIHIHIYIHIQMCNLNLDSQFQM